MKNIQTKNVEEYIEKCPKEAQEKLRKIRDAIREVAPDSTERTDYFQYPDIPMRVMIMMECLPGSALKNKCSPSCTSPGDTRA